MITSESQLIPEMESEEFSGACLLTGRFCEKMYYIEGKYGPFLDPCIAVTFLRNALQCGYFDQSLYNKLLAKVEKECPGVEILNQLCTTIPPLGEHLFLSIEDIKVLDIHYRNYTQFNHLKMTREQYLERNKEIKEDVTGPAPKKPKNKTTQTRKRNNNNNNGNKGSNNNKKTEKPLEVFLLHEDEEKSTIHHTLRNATFTSENLSKDNTFKIPEMMVDQVSYVMEKQGNIKIFLSNSKGKLNARMNSMTFGQDFDCHGDCLMLSNYPVYPDGVNK